MADEVDGRQIEIVKTAVAEFFRDYEQAHPLQPKQVLGISERDIRRIVREELEPINERIREFVASEDIAERTTAAIQAAFQSIGIPIDKDHLDETGSRVRGLVETQKLIDQSWRTVRLSLILAVVAAAFHLLGWHIPLVGAEGG